MAFDLSTAKPVSGKFDLATAKPVGQPAAPKTYDPMVDPPRLPGEEGFDNTPSKAPATGGDRAQAAASGGNMGIAGTLGLPVDTALNVWDLAKAGAGYVQSKATGTAPSEIFDPSDRSQYFGSSQDIANRMNDTGIETAARRPDDAASRYIHAGATGVPGALTGGGGGPNMARQIVSGVVAGDAGQLATDLGLDEGMSAVAATAAGAGAQAARVPRGKAPVKPYEAKTDAQRARAIDQKLLPSEVGDAPIGTVLEGMAGSQNVRRHMNKKNEATNTKLAAQKIGADPKNMGKKSTDKLKDKEGAAYDAMKGIGQIKPDGTVHADIGALSADKSTMTNKAVAKAIQDELATLEGPVDAAQLVERVRELRQQASFNQSPPQGIGSKADPKKVALGKVQRKIADALDGMLERNATAIGSPEVATNYRKARQNIAKINSVQDATVGRKVQASELAKQADREVPLNEELGLIADAGEAFPHSTSRPVVGTETISDTNWLQNLVAPVISRVLSSGPYQNSFGRQVAPDQLPGATPEYFQDGRPDFAPRGPGPQDELPPATGRAQVEANRLAGDLELEGQGVAPMPRQLSAETPPATPTEGLPFTPPNGTGRSPGWDSGAAMDLVRQLGLADDVSPRQTLPPFRNIPDTGLSLVEDAPVPQTGRAGGRNQFNPDTIELDAQSPEGPFSFARGERFTPSLNPRSEQPKVRGAVNLADELSLVPEDVPGNYPKVDFDGGGVEQVTIESPPEPFSHRYKVPGSTRISESPEEGYISYAKDGKTRTINDAFVREGSRGKKLGQKNLVKLAKEAAEAGETLNSDVSITAAQLRAYESAKKAGLIDFDYTDAKTAKQALKDGTIAKAGGKPVITNIRPVEEIADVTS